MKHIVLIAAFVLGITSGFGQARVWKSDLAHSKVGFDVKHMVISTVSGRFTDFEATLTSSKEDLTDAVIDATIKTASINTEVAQRDNHLKSDDFLNAEKFPVIKFKSTKVVKTGADTYAITGDLTIRDVTKSAILETKYNGSIKDPGGKTRSGFHATTSINRFDYNVKWNKAIEAGGLIASDMVNITLDLEFVMAKSLPY